MDNLHCVFVYGTLQQGECRSHCWPRPPVTIAAAVSSGALYDLGAYPALIAGEDRVAGELWTFANVDVAEVLHALDRIEGYRNRDDDLYTRRVIPCMLSGAAPVAAWAYLYARPVPLDAVRIHPDESGICRW